MNLLYRQEHEACPNFDKPGAGRVEIMVFEQNRQLEFTTGQQTFVFVQQGRLRFSYGRFLNKYIHMARAIVLPSGCRIQAEVLQDCRIVVIRMTGLLSLCNSFGLHRLDCRYREDPKADPPYLMVNPVLENYLALLERYLDLGIRCTAFMDMKVKELCYILRFFYTKEELSHFLYLLLSNDMEFSAKVNAAYPKAANVRELAKILNYSYSGFIKRFRKVYNVPPYEWMAQNKAQGIYHEINTSDKTLYRIALDYGFSSQGAFTKFCKAQLGTTPNAIRQANRQG